MGSIDRQRDGEGRASAESCRTCSLRDEKQYRSLVRLAALLTGDAETAENVAADAIISAPCSTPRQHSSEHCLTYLQQQVVARSRRRRYRPGSQGQAPGLGQAQAQGHGQSRGPAGMPVRDAAPPINQAANAEFGDLPVITALRRLRPRVREAVVLTYYLDLPSAQAAVVAGVSEGALRASLATAMRALDGQLTPERPGF
jgi:DNA-directed RNA polymerase specialized sigma24 family protein